MTTHLANEVRTRGDETTLALTQPEITHLVQIAPLKVSCQPNKMHEVLNYKILVLIKAIKWRYLSIHVS